MVQEWKGLASYIGGMDLQLFPLMHITVRQFLNLKFHVEKVQKKIAFSADCQLQCRALYLSGEACWLCLDWAYNVHSDIM